MNTIQEQEYNKRFNFGIWLKLLRYVKSYRKLMCVLGFVMVGVAGIDVIFPLMTKKAIDSFVLTRSLTGLPRFMITYGLLIVVQTINVWLLIAIAGKIDMGICYDIRKNGFCRLQELSDSYYDKTAVGWLMARMTSDTTRLGDTIAWGLVDFVWGMTMMIGIAGVMIYTNWKLALISLSMVPILVVISLHFQQKILKVYRKVRKTNSRITGAFNEGISGAKTTKTLVLEKKNLMEFKEITGEMYRSSVQAAIFSSIYLPIVLALGSIGTALALWFGGKAVWLHAISYGTLVLFVGYTIQFFEPVRELARIFAELQSAQASAERILSMVDTEPEIKDSQEVEAVYGTLFKPGKENWPAMRGDISFKNVSFAYKDGETVLKDFNLEVKAGENIALVGETGSGKTTIVNLACRFYEPTESTTRSVPLHGCKAIWVMSFRHRTYLVGPFGRISVMGGWRPPMRRLKRPQGWLTPMGSSLAWKKVMILRWAKEATACQLDRSSWCPLQGQFWQIQGYLYWMKQPLPSIRKQSRLYRRPFIRC